jgi:PAS domain-containing protein
MLMAGQYEENQVELGMRTLFCVFTYAVVAYKIELLNKQAFLGKESSEKTFYRWLRIFETFPEGLALIRGGQIIYANNSLTQMFELNGYESSRDPYND